jgi:hypothetical protein
MWEWVPPSGSGHHHAFYSGTAGGILFVSQAALGYGPRKLIGERERSARGLTWIEITDDGTTSVTAYPAPRFSAPLASETLPPQRPFQADPGNIPAGPSALGGGAARAGAKAHRALKIIQTFSPGHDRHEHDRQGVRKHEGTPIVRGSEIPPKR